MTAAAGGRGGREIRKNKPLRLVWWFGFSDFPLASRAKRGPDSWSGERHERCTIRVNLRESATNPR
jgi:hypothetical protein